VLLIARGLVTVLVVLLVAPDLAFAQLQSVNADLMAVVESDAPAGGRVRAAVHARVPEGYHLQSNAPRNPNLIATTLVVDVPDGVRAVEVVFPKPTEFTLVGGDEPLDVFEREFSIGVQFEIDGGFPLGPADIPARLRYQACNDRLCFVPVTADLHFSLNVVDSKAPRPAQYGGIFGGIAFGTGAPPPPPTAVPRRPLTTRAAGKPLGSAKLDDFAIVATAGGYLGTNEFLTFVKNAEQGVREKGLFDDRGPLAIMLIVLLGGLALNLTPCVLPMIPINLAVIGAGVGAGSRSRGFLLGSVYGAAMALVYGILGVVVVLTTSTFGTINASPWFNVAIAIVFAVLALAMFDVISIDFSRFSASLATAGGRGSLAMAFGMGAVAALLAGACVAPVVIQVVLFSSSLYAQGSVGALALPFLLGVGMAVPWPLAGAGLTALPKPGSWMVRVKQAFGVAILVTAAYYGYLAYTLFADRWVDAGEVTSSVEAMVKDGWHASLDEGLEVAQREHKPVLIDMWATWCKNCLTMDKTTLAASDVKAALDGYVRIKFQAEQPGEPPAAAVMERFGAVGLPTYVILRPPANASQ
jgi:cytochrome c biogenesis protein CcdA/thiol-disulfide isomerase/thioredoxin